MQGPRLKEEEGMNTSDVKTQTGVLSLAILLPASHLHLVTRGILSQGQQDAYTGLQVLTRADASHVPMQTA